MSRTLYNYHRQKSYDKFAWMDIFKTTDVHPLPYHMYVVGPNVQVFTIIYLFSWAFITMQAKSGGTEGTHMTLALLLFPL